MIKSEPEENFLIKYKPTLIKNFHDEILLGQYFDDNLVRMISGLASRFFSSHHGLINPFNSYQKTFRGKAKIQTFSDDEAQTLYVFITQCDQNNQPKYGGNKKFQKATLVKFSSMPAEVWPVARLTGKFSSAHVDRDEEIEKTIRKIEHEVAILKKLQSYPYFSQVLHASRYEGTHKVINPETKRNVKYDYSKYVMYQPRYLPLVVDNLSFKERIIFFQTLASAVNILHVNNISHNDLKADNIFINSFGMPIIGDFGSATTSESRFPALGAYCYLSPEALRNLVINPPKSRSELQKLPIVDPKRDIWALGCVFNQIRTGGLPGWFLLINYLTFVKQLEEMIVHVPEQRDVTRADLPDREEIREKLTIKLEERFQSQTQTLIANIQQIEIGTFATLSHRRHPLTDLVNEGLQNLKNMAPDQNYTLSETTRYNLLQNLQSLRKAFEDKLENTWEALSRLPPENPYDELEKVILKMLCVDPLKRITSEELLKLLNGIAFPMTSF